MSAGVNCLLKPFEGSTRFAINIEQHLSGHYKNKHELYGPANYLQMLGFNTGRVFPYNKWTQAESTEGKSDFDIAMPNNFYAPQEPIVVRAFQGCGPNGTLELEYEDGTFFDNTNFLPTIVKNQITNISGTPWGIVKIGDSLNLARRSGSLTLNPVWGIHGFSQAMGLPFAPLGADDGLNSFGDVRYSSGGEIEVQQVAMLEGSLSKLMMSLLCTSSSSGFNEGDDDFDLGVASLGCYIPHSLLSGGDEDLKKNIMDLEYADNRMLIDS